MDGNDKVMTLARWLAHQRAVPVHLVEATALQLAETANEHEPLDGPRAPLVVQPRGALWLVGKLGGRALLHIFSDAETATTRARELASEDGVSLIVVGQGGDVVSRWRPDASPPLPVESTAAPSTDAAPAMDPVAPAMPALTSPAPRSENPPETSVPAPTASTPEDPVLPLEVRRYTGGWAVMLRGRVIATAPTREKARHKKQALASDPDFVSNPLPDATA
jgi:pyruvate/2-oxoglutarate dehydrogenase complex dihydrolipoamide acyltransferase (E2) component